MNTTEQPVAIVTTITRQIRLERRLPSYWRVTFDHPPVNIFGPETIPQLNEIITGLETDEEVKVVVFDSAVEGFSLTHYDFLASLEDSTSLPPGPTGLQALPDMLARLSRAPVVSIVSIRGRATGVGSELSLASDMRFASREKAILSQWEVGAALVPGGGPMARLPRLIGRGRALEVLLSGEDISGDLAERYGYVNRALPDADDVALTAQIVDTFYKIYGTHPGFRVNHAKGVVAEGSFVATPAASALSRAALFDGSRIPVTVRFSNDGGFPSVADGAPSNPKGMAIKFHMPGRAEVH